MATTTPLKGNIEMAEKKSGGPSPKPAPATGKDAAEPEKETLTMDTADQTLKTANEQVERMNRTLFTLLTEAADVNRAGVKACSASFDALTKGVEEVGTELVTFTRQSLEDATRNGTSMLACKSVDEVLALQTDMVRAGIDSMVSEAVKLTGMSMQATNEVVKPIADQANKAFGLAAAR